MKIVVTDGATLNPGDLSWDALEEFGRLNVYERTSAEEILERCKDAEIVVVNKVEFNRETIESLPKLRLISVSATGYNNIDVEAAAERNIAVTNVPVYGTQSVSQMVFALLLELTQHVGHHSRTVHQGRWSECENFSYWDFPLIELFGLTIGIIGFGRIGQATAKLAKAFGMKVLAYDVVKPAKIDSDIKFVDLDKIFTDSDIITLHCPLTPETDGLVNEERLSKMKKTAFLINASRGQVVNEQDLANALNNGRIAGAGLDVLSTEPPDAENPLLSAENCYITPHIAWATRSARSRLLNGAIDNIKAFIEGKVQSALT